MKPGVPVLRFVFLDGLRGVAAVAVVLYHIGRATGAPWLAPRGYLAVDFFFVLSGFVIAHSYGDRLVSRRLTPPGFFVLRYLRLWPTALLGALIGLLVALFTPAGFAIRHADRFALAAALNLFLVPNMLAGAPGMYPVNPPHWSLLYEIAANYAYGVVARWLRTSVLVLMVTVAAGVFALATARAGNGDHHDLSRVCYSFFIGVLIYRLWSAGRLPAANAGVIVITLAAVLAVPEPFAPHPVLVDTIITIVVFPFIVWIGATARVAEHLEHVASASGELSYPLYAIHYPLVLLATVVPWPHESATLVVMALAGTACLAMIALSISRVYDRPLRHAARRATRQSLAPS